VQNRGYCPKAIGIDHQLEAPIRALPAGGREEEGWFFTRAMAERRNNWLARECPRDVCSEHASPPREN